MVFSGVFFIVKEVYGEERSVSVLEELTGANDHKGSEPGLFTVPV